MEWIHLAKDDIECGYLTLGLLSRVLCDTVNFISLCFVVTYELAFRFPVFIS